MLDARMVKAESALSALHFAGGLDVQAQVRVRLNVEVESLASLHSAAGALLLEAPLTVYRMANHDWALAGTLHRSALARLDIAGNEVKAFLFVLVAVGLAEPNGPARDTDPIAFLQLHDLLFSPRTLTGIRTYPHGGAYRFHGNPPTLPAVRAAVRAELVALPQPSPGLADRSNSPFPGDLGRRQSCREFSNNPSTIIELRPFS